MNFDVNNFVNSLMNGINKLTNANNSKEAEKNMQVNQQQYLNYTETPDEEPAVNKKYMLMYGIPRDYEYREETYPITPFP